MSRTIFFTKNVNRKNEFLAETSIRLNNGKFLVYKESASTSSSYHIDNMLSHFKVLDDVLDSSTLKVVAPVQIKKGTLEFEFIDGISVERKLIEDIMLDNKESTVSTIERLINTVERLPSDAKNPNNNKKYKQVFGESFDYVLDCVSTPIFDLNFDNIIEKDKVWYLIDYEWMFDFPIPRQLLITRFLWAFFYRHREIIAYHAERISCHKLGDDVFIPTYLYSRYRNEFDHLKETLIADANFQRYVYGKASRVNERLADDYATPNPVRADLVLGIDSLMRQDKSNATTKATPKKLSKWQKAVARLTNKT